MPVDLERAIRQRLWDRVVEAMESYRDGVAGRRVGPEPGTAGDAERLARADFARPMDPLAAVELAVRGLLDHQVHTPHPRYFGLFSPAPAPMGIAADALVA